MFARPPHHSSEHTVAGSGATGGRSQQRRRLFWAVLAWTAACAALLSHLFVVQCVSPRLSAGRPEPPVPWRLGLRAGAELEHLRLQQTDDARGRILYRSGLPWSGAVALQRLDGGRGASELTVHSERTELTSLASPVVGDVGLPDVWPGTRAVAEQGRSGLEAAFDRQLAGSRPGYVGVLTDATGHLQTKRFTLSPQAGNDVRTTIEAAWQRRVTLPPVPTASSDAVVVEDVASGDILAMSSHDRQHPLANSAVLAQTPGSVFKLVIAAAALDSYSFSLRSRFHCFGLLSTPSVHMHCWRVHGRETLALAIAQSCDVALAQTGIAIGRPAIEVMSNHLHVTEDGLQRAAGRRVLADAQPGRVFAQRGADPGLLANTSIGQQDVRLSPLQATNIAAAIARGGVWRNARLVLDEEKGGLTRHSFPGALPQRAMSRATAQKLAYAMRLAVTAPSGTAHQYAASPATAAIKTGTAEVPGQLVNAWVVGFAPADHPRVAFCAFVGHARSQVAHDGVKRLTDAVLSSYLQFSAPPVIG